MTDETLTGETPMTDSERAEAYETEAAALIDRLTARAFAGMPPTEPAKKFIELIVQASVLRMKAAAPTPCPETWQPAIGGEIGYCTLNAGHAGKCQMKSRPHG